MANVSTLVINYSGQAGGSVKFSYKYADPETPIATVKALINGLIANGSIFENPPVTTTSAKLVTQTEANYDLSN